MSMSKILGFMRKADEEFNLIEDGDKIAVGISGGKDSTLLLAALQLYRFYSKKKFDFIGIHINIGFEKDSFNSIVDYCKENKIEFYMEDSNPPIYEVLEKNLTNQNKLSCSLCSRMKKAAMNEAAHRYNCNKVAFAHHIDDAIETLFLNCIYGGRVATFKPKIYLSNTELTFIRPFIYIKEEIIIKTAKDINIPVIKSNCPNDKTTKRQEMKELLDYIYKKYPEAKSNFQLLLSNTEQAELWEKENKEE